MEEKKFNEMLNEVLAGLTDEQKTKVAECKGSSEILDLLGKMGVALPDELLDEAAGGYVRSTVKRPTEWDTCYLCSQRKNVDDMMYTVINGERRHVCCKCMGVR